MRFAQSLWVPVGRCLGRYCWYAQYVGFSVFVRKHAKRRYFTDRNNYYVDKLANVDGNCSIVSQESFVTFNDNCTVHILKMCNGLMHCDDCADEVYEDCVAQQCSEGANLYSEFSFVTILYFWYFMTSILFTLPSVHLYCSEAVQICSVNVKIFMS